MASPPIPTFQNGRSICLATSTATLVEPTERTPLLKEVQNGTGKPVSPPQYDHEEEGAEGKEVELLVPGKSNFSQTVSVSPPPTMFRKILLMLDTAVECPRRLDWDRSSCLPYCYRSCWLGPWSLASMPRLWDHFVDVSHESARPVAVFTDTFCSLKILIRIIEKDRSMRNFADVARYSLGARAEKWTTAMFVSDCCIWM